MKGFADAAALESALALLHDAELMEFVQEHQHNYLYRADFMKEPMPGDADPALMWELVSFVRRMAGRPIVRELNKSQPIGRQCFWTATPEMIAGLNDIVSRSNPSAQLTQSLARLSTRPAIQQLALEELEAAGYRDGVDVEHEELREIVCDKRAPETPEERLFANARELIEEIEELASEPFNVELIAYMHERLALDTKGLRVEPRPSPAPKTSVPSPPSDQLLESIVAGCENPCLWGPHPLFGALINADTIWVTPAFERFNGLMELLIRWRSYYAIGVPALRFVPLSKMRLDWERRLVGPPDAPMRYGEALVVSSFGVDSTPYSQQMIHFLDRGLNRLERIVARTEEIGERCKHLIFEDRRLTLRQKQLLADLVDNPLLVVDVGMYEKRFDIAASTARADLTRLVSLNFLLTEFSAKKQVFWLRPDISRVLASRSAASTPASSTQA